MIDCFIIEENFLVMHNTDNINQVFFILFFSLIMCMVRVINVYYSVGSVSYHNLFWYFI